MNETPTPAQQIEYQIEGMDCANCALTLERSLADLPGLSEVQVNFTTARLHATADVNAGFDPQAILKRVADLGYRALEPGLSAPAPTALPASGNAVVDFLRFLLAERRTSLIVFGGGLLLLSTPLGWLGEAAPAAPLLTLIRIAILGVVGYPIARKGLRALLAARQMTIDLLMTIAALGAVLIGETSEAATVMVLFALGEALEAYTAERARRSLRSLLSLRPEEAGVLRPCLDCAEHLGQEGYTGGPCPWCGIHETRVAIAQVQVGEIVLVRPGERIPVDGAVRSGVSSVNQAPVTGESMPVQKEPGSEVFAGTLNGEAALEIEVSRPAQDSTISRMLRLVEQAQSSRTPVERFIDRFAARYTPVVVLSALLLAVVPPLFGQPFWDLPDGSRGWLYRALGLLIVACPCALVISTPVSVVSALSGLAQRGVLVKGGAFLDVLAGVRVFAFDKTGTLTQGKPRVLNTQTLACPPDSERCEACDDMLALAAAVESRSEHPLAQAVLDESHSRQLNLRYPAASEVTAETGRGVRGRINGWLLAIRSHNHEYNPIVEHADLHTQIEQAEQNGQTVMLVSKNQELLGFVSVADEPRASSRQALQQLKALDPNLRTIMLTGDNLQAAQRIAADLGGIDEVRAGLLPAEKMGVIRDLQTRYGAVAMVGDGVNDTPALAAASVGIALGGAGTAQALETADIVLMQDDLHRLPDAVRTSRRTRQIIWQNIIFSLLLKVLFLVLVLPGWATLWMAVFADMGASLLVTLNGMRLVSEPKTPRLPAD